MRDALIVPLEFLGVWFVGIGFLNIILDATSYKGDVFLIEGILIEIFAFQIYYGEKNERGT